MYVIHNMNQIHHLFSKPEKESLLIYETRQSIVSSKRERHRGACMHAVSISMDDYVELAGVNNTVGL
jgi:hypothetical protein